MAAVAARDGKPGNDVQALIDACRWAALAKMLVKDEVLAKQLSQTGGLLPKTYEKLLVKIGRFRKTYFTSLFSPSSFLISAHAGKLSTSRSSRRSGGTLPRYNDECQEDKDLIAL